MVARDRRPGAVAEVELKANGKRQQECAARPARARKFTQGHAYGEDGRMPGRDTRSLVDHSRTVLSKDSEDRIFRFLVDGDGEPPALGDAASGLRGRTVAATLWDRFPAGGRVPVMCPAGLDHVYADTAAAPAPPQAAPDRAGAPAADGPPDLDAMSAAELEALLTAKTTQIDEGAQR
ncbi:hypothetical protein GTY73_14205 [Streptomyces sp. SID8354]|nr:hypothetical protein [Streptomyces sp. SID8354]